MSSEICPPDENTHYWREFRTCSDDNFIIVGSGLTKQQCIEDSNSKQAEREKFLALSDTERLKILLNQKYILMNDLNEAVKIMGKMLLELYSPMYKKRDE